MKTLTLFITMIEDEGADPPTAAPIVSLPASLFGAGEERPAGPDPFADLPRHLRRVEVVCLRPIHHALEYEELHRLLEALRRRLPDAEVVLHFRSALRDDAPFEPLPADRLERLTTRNGRGRLAAGLRRLAERWSPGTAAVLLAPPPGWRRFAARHPRLGAVAAAPLGFTPSGPSTEGGRAAAGAFFHALLAAQPRWTLAPDPPAPLPRRPGLRVLVHQARFHVGDALWLTPLLAALHRRLPEPEVTVVASPGAARVLAGNPYIATLLPYHPDSDATERAGVLAALADRTPDIALFAFARRPESRWLAEATAALGVPWRIDLEYFDGALDEREPWAAVTHQGWLYWGTMASPSLLLHALDPLLGPLADPERGESWEDGEAMRDGDRRDGRVELYLAGAEAERRAGERLAAAGIGDRPFVLLSPGGRSSRRWPAERFAALALALTAELGVHALFEGGPDETALLGEIAARTAGEPRVAVAQDPLDVLAALLRRAHLLIGNDSSPIHLAEALATPTLYFAEREKLLHSHPRGVAWALFDDLGNDPSRISVDQARAAANAMRREGILRPTVR